MEKAEGKMNSMLGAICGDILGSTYEFGNADKEISLMHEEDHMTDDSVLTCAIAEWVMKYGNVSALGEGEQKYLLAKILFNYTTRYEDKAYGVRYVDWYFDYEKTGKVPDPPNSMGNGCAMRVSPIAYGYKTLREVEKFAQIQAEVTHNNPEGIRGACAIAAATKMALDGKNKKEIKDYISSKYFYDLSQNIENVRMKDGDFSAICPVTVPQAFIAFFEGEDYESTILNSIVIGGDCDTVAAMAGSIAYAYYKKIPDYLLKHCFSCMDEKIKKLCRSFCDEYLTLL